MELHMTEKQFRRLLDLVYIGNWVLNSTRGDDRIKEYDQVESLVFAHCLDHGMTPLTELYQGELIPSRAFADGGIHEAIMAYEDATFFEILAQELALRDLDDPPITPENYDEIMELFFANPGVALVREKILEGVWGENYFGDVKIVDVNIRRLRMKIEDEPSAPKHILTVWGYGYRWNA